MAANFCLHRLGVGCISFARNHTRVKVAVGALGLAERNLDVDAEAHGRTKNCSTSGSARFDLVRSDSVGNDLHEDAALPWTIEFAKENPLPGTEQQFAAVNDDRLTGTGQHRLHVRVGVALSVAIRAAMRDEAVKDAF